MLRLFRFAILTLAIGLVPAVARAEWQIKPFGGVTFGGSTTFIFVEDAAGKPKLNVGASVLWQGEVLGVEGDVGTTSGFFNGGNDLVLGSRVTTVTGNVVLALPKRLAQYTLRPYVVGGLGMMHVGWNDVLQVLPYSNWLSAWDLGAGATGFITDRVGVNWDVRMFKTLPTAESVAGYSVGPEQLSFWRATMGLSIRF